MRLNFSNDEAQLVFNQLKTKVKKIPDTSIQPNGIDGIRILVEYHKELENSLLSFIESFQTDTVGAWICAGWENCITTVNGKKRLRKYIEELRTTGAKLTKKAAETALK